MPEPTYKVIIRSLQNQLEGSSRETLGDILRELEPLIEELETFGNYRLFTNDAQGGVS